MVLGIPMLFSVFCCTSGKLLRCRSLRGPFTLFPDFEGSEVVEFNAAVVVLFIGFLICRLLLLLEDASVLVLSLDSLLGVSRYAVSTLSTEGLFFAGGFLAVMRNVAGNCLIDCLISA
jgi:hypothetical protein